jgi:hypothetical protein
MQATLLDGSPATGKDPFCERVHFLITKELRNRGLDTTPFALATMNIKPCRGCFSCWVKTPGVCIIRDDEEAVLRNLATSELTVWLTPITFGGYSPELKKALDRAIPILLPFFKKVHGEIHHPQRYALTRRLLAIGILPGQDDESEWVFRHLVGRNAINLAATPVATAVLRKDLDDSANAAELQQALTEVA